MACNCGKKYVLQFDCNETERLLKYILQPALETVLDLQDEARNGGAVNMNQLKTAMQASDVLTNIGEQLDLQAKARKNTPKEFDFRVN